MSMAQAPKRQPNFLLFRREAAEVPAGVTHTGLAHCAHCERLNYLEVHVTEPSEECPVKHFEGETYAVNIREPDPRKAQPAQPPKRQASLALEQLPFNDPLPAPEIPT